MKKVLVLILLLVSYISNADSKIQKGSIDIAVNGGYFTADNFLSLGFLLNVNIYEFISLQYNYDYINSDYC